MIRTINTTLSSILFAIILFTTKQIHSLELLHSDPIAYSVDVVTGNYCDARQDLSQLTPPHQSLIRTYNSSNGWNYSFFNLLNYNTVKIDRKIELLYAINSITSEANKDRPGDLTTVYLNDKVMYQYYYESHPTKEGQILTEWTAGDGSHYIIEYYGDQDGKVSPWKGRVKAIQAKVDDSDHLGVVATFTYAKGQTDVYDIFGKKKSYFYNDNGYITAVEEFSGNTLYRRQRFYWTKHPQRNLWLLTSHVSENGQMQAMACTTYQYDNYGNRCEETIHKNTSVDPKEPLHIDSYGNLKTAAKHTYSKRWKYSATEPALLLSHSEDNGKHTEYVYDKTWGKAKEIFLYENKIIQRRWFSTYDDHGLPIEIICDNGTTKQKDNDEGVTSRFYTEYTHSKDSTHKKLLKVVNGTEDPTTKVREVSQKIIHTYDAQHRPASIEVYDANDKFIEKQLNAYPVAGLKEIRQDAKGNSSITSYDIWNRIETIENVYSDGISTITHHQYDTAGNLACIKTKNSQGNQSSTQYTYNAAGLKIGSTSSDGTSISYQYDDLRRLTSMTTTHNDPTNSTKTVFYNYDIFDNITSESNTNEETISDHLVNDQWPFSETLNWLWKWYESTSVSMAHLRTQLSIEDSIEKECLSFVNSNFSRVFILLAGFSESVGTFGIYQPGKEIDPKVKITVINGILNLKEDLEETINQVYESHGGNQIYFVYRPTEGWTRDVFSCGFSKLGIISPTAEMLATLWRQLIEEMGGINGGGHILHYAHSIGATDSYLAGTLLTPDERKMIEVVTIGSPTMISHEFGFKKIANYVSVRDGVGYIGLLSAPLRYVQSIFSTDYHIHFVGTHWGIPIIDHPLYFDAYKEIIENLGDQFLEKYSEK